MRTLKLGDSVRTLRTANGMTQAQFGTAIGVEAVHVCNVERGKKGFSYETLNVMCKKFSVSMEDLIQADETLEIDEKRKKAKEEREAVVKEKLIAEINQKLREQSISKLRLVNSALD